MTAARSSDRKVLALAALALDRARKVKNGSPGAPGQPGPSPAAEDVAAAARAVIIQLRPELKGEPGDPPTAEQVAGLVRQEFERRASELKGSPGEPGRAPAKDEVLDLVRDVIREFHAELRGEPGKAGDAPTRAQIVGAVEQVLVALAPQLRGEPGPMGPMPRHEWRGTELRFQLQPHIWGPWVDLRGPEGPAARPLPRQRRGANPPEIIVGGGGVNEGRVREIVEEILSQFTAESPMPVRVIGSAEIANDEGGQLRADSGEVEYSPGPVAGIVTTSGDHDIYGPGSPAQAFRIRSSYAIPVTRTGEEPPVITLKILDGDDNLVQTIFCGAAFSKRKVYPVAVGNRLVLNLDIAARVPYTFDIEDVSP